MKEILIEFKTAKVANIKGFPQESYPKYSFDGSLITNYTNAKTAISAPTQSLLQKWLRDECGIDVYVSLLGGYYLVNIYTTNRNHCKECYGKFHVFEEALEDGLFKALNLIKKDE